MGNPKPGTPEWQAWINSEVAKHDAEQAKQGQQFETGGAEEQAQRGDKAAGK